MSDVALAVLSSMLRRQKGEDQPFSGLYRAMALRPFPPLPYLGLGHCLFQTVRLWRESMSTDCRFAADARRQGSVAMPDDPSVARFGSLREEEVGALTPGVYNEGPLPARPVLLVLLLHQVRRRSLPRQLLHKLHSGQPLDHPHNQRKNNIKK